MRVAELMSTDPLTIDPETSIQEAHEILERCGIRHLAIVRGTELVGIVSDHDLVPAVEELAHRQVATPEDPTLSIPTVAQIMGSETFTVGAESDVLEATRLILQHKVGCLPVVRNGRVVGLLTERDILGAFVHACETSEASGDRNPTVATRMTRNRISATPNTPVGEALKLCATADIRHLLVMHDSETLAGIVSDRDLSTLAARSGGAAPIRDCIARDPIVTWPDAPLVAAARIMLTESLSSLPVVEDDRPVGILTITDVLDHCLTTDGALRSWSE